MRRRTHVAAVLTAVLSVGCCVAAATGSQNLRALARAHAAEKPGVLLEMTGPPAAYPAKDIAELAKESAVILRGTLVRSSTYLGPREDRILTDYRIQVPQLIAGSLPAITKAVPGNVPPWILTVYGGELKLEGAVVRVTDPNRAEIVEGQEYLLFLMPSRRNEAGYYEVYSGGIFEVSGSVVKSILRDGEEIFKGIGGSKLEDLIVNIKAARGQLP